MSSPSDPPARLDATSAALDASFFATDGEWHFGRVRPPRPEWLARAEPEDVLLPELPIVDTHHHLWDRPGDRYMLDEVVADIRAGHNIVSTVAVEAGFMYRSDGPVALRPVGETEFVERIGRAADALGSGSPRVAEGFVAYADLSLGDDVDAVLEAHLEASARVRAVRYLTSWDADPTIGVPNATTEGMLRAPETVAGARAVARRGLTLDVNVFFPQLDDVRFLAEQVPELTLVLGHVGTPLGYGTYGDDPEAMHRRWRAGLAAVAAHPNVAIKLGGMMMRLAAFDYRTAERPATSAELAHAWRPYLLEAIELFGVERCTFESNFPVEKMGVGARALWNAFKRVTEGASPDERAELFAGTARRVYRLDGAVSAD